MNDIIPLLLKYDVIEQAVTNNSLQTNLRAWKLKHIDVSDVYKAEDHSCIHHEYIECPECKEEIQLSDDEYFGY